MTSRINLTEDNAFVQHATALLNQLETQLDAQANDLDIDIDLERSGGVLTLKLPSKQVVVINLQSPMQQVWLASPLGAYHYAFDGAVWQDTRGGLDFIAQLNAALNALTQKKFTLAN